MKKKSCVLLFVLLTCILSVSGYADTRKAVVEDTFNGSAVELVASTSDTTHYGSLSYKNLTGMPINRYLNLYYNYSLSRVNHTPNVTLDTDTSSASLNKISRSVTEMHPIKSKSFGKIIQSEAGSWQNETNWAEHP